MESSEFSDVEWADTRRKYKYDREHREPEFKKGDVVKIVDVLVDNDPIFNYKQKGKFIGETHVIFRVDTSVQGILYWLAHDDYFDQKTGKKASHNNRPAFMMYWHALELQLFNPPIPRQSLHDRVEKLEQRIAMLELATKE